MVIITIVTITVMINVTAWVLVWSWVGQKHDVEIQSSSKSLTWSTVAVLESHPGLKSFAISIVNIIIFIDTTDLINSHYACVLAFFIMVSITIKSNHQNHCPRHARVSARNHLHDHLDHHHHTTDLINSHYARILARRAAAVGRRQRWRALLQVPGKFRLKYCAVRNESKWKYEHSICFCSPWSIAPLSCWRYGKCVDGVCVPGRLVDQWSW